MPKLVLFDIDGTLINPGGAGRISLTHTFFQMFSVRNAFVDIRMAGKTDIQIIKEGLSVHGLPEDHGIMPAIISVYIENLKRAIGNRRKYVNPGVVELLSALKKVEEYRLGLLTGNIEPGARIKLEAFGLNAYFPFGAFGDDNEDRDKLLPIAINKFRAFAKVDINFADCIVIGDTPSDVQCSKPYGATSIAVSTGPYTYESLLKTEADHVLKDLSDAMPLFPILSSHIQATRSQFD